MALKLIHGPPNSGRAGRVRSGLTAARDASPLLVVPTFDDVDAFERELTSGGALLGVTVTTFDGQDGLFAMVASAGGAPPLARLTRAQRLRVASVAVAAARDRLGPLRRSARRPGFAASLERLLGELQAAGLAPAGVEAGAGTLEGSAYLADLAALFAAYEQAREVSGHVDQHGIARDALGALAEGGVPWAGRPLFVYGFDDLTAHQLELLRRLGEITEVTISLPLEAERFGLGARPELVARLREEIGIAEETATLPDPGNTPARLLFDLERGFGVPEAAPSDAQGGLSLLRSAGLRGEAEAIAARIGRLLFDGAAPDEIAIVLRDPARRGPLVARMLESYGAPVALEAELPLASSGIGGALIALLEAEHGTRRADDALRWLRGPAGVRPGKVDSFERAVRVARARTSPEAWAIWTERWEELPADLIRLREAGPASVAVEVGEITTRFLGREAGRDKLDAESRRERQAAATIAAAMAELAELGALAPGPAETIACLRELRFRAWSGPVDGRVRIASPERLRAGRFDHVVIGSLQEGEFPRRGGEDSFLSEAQREALGLEARRDGDAYERYLFYAAFSRARKTLTLSYRDCDEAGAAEARSPFIDEVRRLLAPPHPAVGPDPVEEALTAGRALADPVFAAVEAPSEDELARAVAATRSALESAIEGAGPPLDVASRVEARVAAARAAEEATRAPGPLRDPAVLASLREVPAHGGTTLEGFDSCSYRWFVDHELSPRPLGPMPEAIEQGGLMHAVLERLYGERPGGDPLPRPGSIAAWVERGRSLVAELAAERGIGDSPPERVIRRGVERLLGRFLAEEAAREAGQFEPWLLEAAFGEGEDAERPALEFDGWRLHGAIDRVDRAPDGRVFVHDYKVASRASAARKLEEDGKLQLQLYLIAAAELWGSTPAGALYHPLRATSERRPRGLVLGDEAGGMPDHPLVRTDVLSEEEFEGLLEEARARGGAIVARMRDGDIRRDPGPRRGLRGHDVCPRYCDFAPICRRDRAPVPEDEREQEER